MSMLHALDLVSLFMHFVVASVNLNLMFFYLKYLRGRFPMLYIYYSFYQTLRIASSSAAVISSDAVLLQANMLFTFYLFLLLHG